MPSSEGLRRWWRLSCLTAIAWLMSSAGAQLVERDGYNYNGGVALRWPNTTCPPATNYIGTSLEANCCPYGQIGAPQGSGYCCPEKTNCLSEVENYVKCADPSWIYCKNPNNVPIGFCCLKGWVCWEQSDGVGCGPPGYRLAASQTAVSTIPFQTSNSVSSPTSTSGSTSSPTNTSGSSSSSSSPSSDTGVIAGSVVGGILGLAIIAALVFWLVKRTKVRDNAQESGWHQKPWDDPPRYYKISQAPNQPIPARRFELDTAERYELEARTNKVELPTTVGNPHGYASGFGTRPL